MKTFSCPHCQQTVFFENNRCENCGQAIGYSPQTGEMQLVGSGWRACTHAATELAGLAACNWLQPEGADQGLCLSCQHTAVVPDLGDPEQLRLWMKLEAAKRRLFHTLLSWGLPLDEPGTPGALTFEFKADMAGEQPVMTGHLHGRITLNLAEADDAVREAVRAQMGEPYRRSPGTCVTRSDTITGIGWWPTARTWRVFAPCLATSEATMARAWPGTTNRARLPVGQHIG